MLTAAMNFHHTSPRQFGASNLAAHPQDPLEQQKSSSTIASPATYIGSKLIGNNC